MTTNFQNRVLLIGNNISEHTKEYFNEYCPYAILLVGERSIYKSFVSEKNYDGGQEPLAGECTIFRSSQNCITYNTEEDFKNGNGTFNSDIPDEVDQIIYEYTAKVI